MYIDLTLKPDPNNPLAQQSKKQASELLLQGHYGTHLDIHSHSSVPLEYMHRRGILFDVSHVAGRDVDSNDIEFHKIQANDFVIFKTDMIKRHQYGHRAYFSNHSQLSNTLIDALIEKKVSFIGIDAAGVRNGREHITADKRCEEEGIFIIENLDNLDSISMEIFEVTTSWLEIPGKTGLPCRVVVRSIE